MTDVTKDLLDAIKAVMPYVVTQVVACHGLKCRESVCQSCTHDAEGNADKACAAYQAASEAIARAEAALSAPQADADGWIPWAGGECPVGVEAIIDMRLRNGMEFFRQIAGMCDWDDDDSSADIIAYRVVEAQP